MRFRSSHRSLPRLAEPSLCSKPALCPKVAFLARFAFHFAVWFFPSCFDLSSLIPGSPFWVGVGLSLSPSSFWRDPPL